MADLTTTFASDNRRARQGIRQVRDEVTGLQRAMQRGTQVRGGETASQVVGRFAQIGVAFTTVTAMIRGSAAAMREYQREFPILAQQMQVGESASKRLSLSLGRDLSLTMMRFNGVIDGTLARFSRLRDEVVTFNAAALGMDSFGANRELADAEAEERRQASVEALAAVRRDSDRQALAAQVELARAAGDERREAELSLRVQLDGFQRLREERLKAINDNQRLRAAERAAAVESVEAAFRAQAAAARATRDAAVRGPQADPLEGRLASIEMARRNVDASERLGRDRRQVELEREGLRYLEERARLEENSKLSVDARTVALADAQRFHELNVRAIQREFDAEDRSRREVERDRSRAVTDAALHRRVEIARLAGLDREAEALELHLRFARERRDIERDEVLLAEDKRRALAQLAEDEQRITGLVMQRTRDERDGRRERGVAGGTLGGRNVMAQQVGVRADQKTADSTARTAKMTEEIRNLLRQLGVVLAQPRPGVFG